MTAQGFLLECIADSWLDGNSEGLSADTPLLELNIISSAEVFDLVHAIQAEFGIVIPLQEVRPDNFRSVAVIADLIDRFRGK
ncbi:acyl carrier protein [Nocardia salmonicida]|uniref:acyl carrier protein n=1 Tax=Nocardia salmonicida TaxID=53431 RepID=UPI0007A3E133|nr:acyl carrier protein [Nocardia salmonicida]